jgi:hypothetical protein
MPPKRKHQSSHYAILRPARPQPNPPMLLPYGYRWNGTEIEIDPEQAEQVRRIFQAVAAQ